MDVHHGLNGSCAFRSSARTIPESLPSGAARGTFSAHTCIMGTISRGALRLNGRAYDRFYRGYSYHGVFMNVYAPARYYPLGFMAGRITPVILLSPTAGAGRRPWYGYYGDHFNPYPVYAALRFG